MTEQEYKEHIYKKADAVKTEEDLLSLLKEIKTYGHDYGTIVYGCMAAMTGAFKVVNEGPQGGITGFQASCLGWELIRKYMMVQGPLKLIDFNNMLYPQYARKFQKEITQDTWEEIQKLAKENLTKSANAHEEVLAHWKSIKDGKVPFGYTVVQEQ